MRFMINPNAKEFIPRKARWEHHHSRELNVGSLVRTHGRKNGSVGVGWDGCTQPTETEARTGLRNREAREARKRSKGSLVAVATCNVHTLAIKEKHGYGHDACTREGPTNWL